VDGISGKARNFNGTSDYVTVPDAPSFANLTEGTVEAWVNTPNANRQQPIINKDGFGSNNDLRLEIISSGQVYFGIDPGGTGTSYLVQSPSPLLSNRWYHIAGTWGSFGLQLYVNGVLVGTSSNVGMVNNNFPVRIGTIVSGEYFQGIIDEVSIANVARTFSPDPVLSVTPANRDVPATAGNTTFNVTNSGGGTLNWSATVTSGADWLSITSGASGTNSGTITVAYTANCGNSSRTGTIRVTAPGAAGGPIDVMVTQATPSTLAVLVVSPSSSAPEVNLRAGDSVLVSITAKDQAGNTITTFNSQTNIPTILTLLNSTANAMNDPTGVRNNWRATIRHAGTGTVLYGLGVSNVNATGLFSAGVLQVWVINTKAERGVQLQVQATTPTTVASDRRSSVNTVITGTSAKVNWSAGLIYTVSINSNEPNLVSTASTTKDIAYINQQYFFKLRLFDRYGNRNLTDSIWITFTSQTGFWNFQGFGASIDQVVFMPNSNADSAATFSGVPSLPVRTNDEIRMNYSTRNNSTPFFTRLDPGISTTILAIRKVDVLTQGDGGVPVSLPNMDGRRIQARS
jgi:hypothetical protein